MEVLYETGDVAKVLRVAPGTVRRLADRGQLPIAAVTSRGVRLFRPGDVEFLATLRGLRRGFMVQLSGDHPNRRGEK